MIRNEIDTSKLLEIDLTLPESNFGLSEQNNTYFFLLPMCGINRIRDFPSFAGVYQNDKNRNSSLENCVYVISKLDKLENIDQTGFHKYISACNDYKYNYYLGTCNNIDTVAYVVSCKDKYIDDYNHIIEGNYSLVSNDYVNEIKSFGFTKENTRRLVAICRKEEWYKEELENYLNVNLTNSELWSKFEPEREILNYKCK